MELPDNRLLYLVSELSGICPEHERGREKFNLSFWIKKIWTQNDIISLSASLPSTVFLSFSQSLLLYLVNL